MRHEGLMLEVYEPVGEGEVLALERVEQTLDRHRDGLVGMLPVPGHGCSGLAGRSTRGESGPGTDFASYADICSEYIWSMEKI